MESRTTTHQAYVDLLKASYILYDVILRDDTSPDLLVDENRKLISDLSDVRNKANVFVSIQTVFLMS